MNGFANSILSFLLSWIRTLIANIWTVVTSEDGGALYQFLAAHWMWILVVLCVGGFALDRIIYFIRWRPHYVWLSRRTARRGRRTEPEAAAQPEPIYEAPDAAPAQMAVYPAQSAAPLQQPFAPTMQYAPQRAGYTQVYQPPAQDWLNEDDVQWDEPEPAFDAPAYAPPPQPARQSTMAYYRDMQAGFAPAVAPEQLYASPRQAVPESAPVHPGLNEDVFRQNIGLEPEGEAPRWSAPVVHAPAFRPFTAVQEEAEPIRTPNAFSRFARRARDLVGMTDDDNAPTIHDLQSTVDVTHAFHEPVYPQATRRDDPL